MISKVFTLYTATGAALAVREGIPVIEGIAMGLVVSAVVVALGYLLNRMGVLIDL